MSLSKIIVCGVCVASVISMVVPAHAGITYVGTLSVGNGGLMGANNWNNASTTLTWTVSDEVTAGLWHYAYTLTVPSTAVSHMIVEVSDGDPGPAFSFANLFSPTTNPSGWIDDPIEIQTYNPGPSNPNMPGSVYGIKFNAADDADATTLTLAFDSDRVPVWGDFYAKGGSNNTLFNTGFAADDPSNPPSNGSCQYHVLVPDTTTVNVPAPGALLLGGFGTGLLGWLRRRRTV